MEAIENFFEDIIGLTKSDMNYITLKTSSKGQGYWDIKVSSKIDEWQRACDKILELKNNIEKILNEGIYEKVESSKISKVNFLKDDIVVIKYQKSSTGKFSHEIKLFFANDKEDENKKIDILNNINNFFRKGEE